MPTSRTISLGEPFVGLSLQVMEWGAPGGRTPVVCVHGLTRNARDFDPLAEVLARDRQVFAVDVAGRGGSSWLSDPGQYRIEAYAGHLSSLLARLGLSEVDWVGTSMGGLIGMLVAAHPGTPVRRFVINDVGPLVPQAALQAIATYLGYDLLFPDLTALEQHLRLIHAPFGPLTDAQWRHLAEHSSRRVEGGYRLHYDPAIRLPFIEDSGRDSNIWEVYERITCPTLLIRGEVSLLLTPEIAAAMQQRGPRPRLVTFPGIGHAPALMADDQIAVIKGFLDAETA